MQPPPPKKRRKNATVKISQRTLVLFLVVIGSLEMALEVGRLVHLLGADLALVQRVPCAEQVKTRKKP